MLGQKMSKNKAEAAVFFPHGGLSMIDLPGKPMYNPPVDELLFKTIKENADNGNVEFYDYDCSINDEEFAVAVAKKMDEYMKKHYG